jgi:hypothetical protein
LVGHEDHRHPDSLTPGRYEDGNSEQRGSGQGPCGQPKIVWHVELVGPDESKSNGRSEKSEEYDGAACAGIQCEGDTDNDQGKEVIGPDHPEHDRWRLPPRLLERAVPTGVTADQSSGKHGIDKNEPDGQPGECNTHPFIMVLRPVGAGSASSRPPDNGGMGFAFRVSRGFRVAATPRGLRAGIGPRYARMHVGSGPVGISTGVGPFTTWTSLNSGAPRATPGAPQRQAQYEQALAEHESLMTVHRERFAAVQRPVLAPAERIDRATIEERTYSAYRTGIRGVGWWRIGERRRIHREARARVLQEAEAEYAAAVQEVAADQDLADQWWQMLNAGDPETVIDALNDAFYDNVQEAIAVDAADGEASIVLAMPQLEDVPERYPALTPAGRPTTKVYTQTDRNALHLHLILAHVAVTLREAFAVVPSLQHVRMVVVERLESVEVVLAGVFPRSVIDRLDDDDAPMNLLDLGQEVIVNRTGRTNQVAPIDVSSEPDLAELAVMLIDVDQLS